MAAMIPPMRPPFTPSLVWSAVKGSRGTRFPFSSVGIVETESRHVFEKVMWRKLHKFCLKTNPPPKKKNTQNFNLHSSGHQSSGQDLDPRDNCTSILRRSFRRYGCTRHWRAGTHPYLLPRKVDFLAKWMHAVPIYQENHSPAVTTVSVSFVFSRSFTCTHETPFQFVSVFTLTVESSLCVRALVITAAIAQRTFINIWITSVSECLFLFLYQVAKPIDTVLRLSQMTA